MAIDIRLLDGRGGSQSACCTSRGELVVNRFDYSTAYNAEATVVNTGYNFVPPISGKQFVVTDMLLYANKSVGASDATVEVYEADGVANTVVTRSVFKTEMLKNTRSDMVGLNMIVSEGKWLNIKTDDNTIFATVMGYYIPA